MSFLSCVFGPRLYVEYGDGQEKIYDPSFLEIFGDQVISFLNITKSLCFYTWPIFGIYLYCKGAFEYDNIHVLIKFCTSICAVIVMSWLLRGAGRFHNPHYGKFLRIYQRSNIIKDGRNLLKKFDFDFKKFDIDFDAANVEKRQPTNITSQTLDFSLLKLPSEIIAYLSMYSFGIRLMYPGSIKPLQQYLRPVLISGRTRLMQDKGAKRFKIKTYDWNELDTIFVDNRGKNVNGDTLVICCEGNAGFYEIGLLSTPLSQQYSAIDWNHPGFEGSTGTPFPDQEKNAIESIIAFAIEKLQFREEDIALFGWSIGGFSALWGASCYPNIKGVILDATFDDVLPLATAQMPRFLSTVVNIGIRRYCNLNNNELLPGYNGPVLLIRRLNDEIIAHDNILATNRGNNLVLNLLEYRYPYIFTENQVARVEKLLSEPLNLKQFSKKNDSIYMEQISMYASDQGKVFPMKVGEDYSEEKRTEIANFLLLRHIQDVQLTHCTPLPTDFFKMPWDIPIIKGVRLA